MSGITHIYELINLKFIIKFIFYLFRCVHVHLGKKKNAKPPHVWNVQKKCHLKYLKKLFKVWLFDIYIFICGQYSLQTVRPRRYSQNLNVSVLCPLPPTFGLSRVYDSITLTDKTPKTGSISTKTCRSIHNTGLPIILDGLKISATGSLALTQYREFFYSDRYI